MMTWVAPLSSVMPIPPGKAAKTSDAKRQLVHMHSLLIMLEPETVRQTAPQRQVINRESCTSGSSSILNRMTILFNHVKANGICSEPTRLAHE